MHCQVKVTILLPFIWLMNHQSQPGVLWKLNAVKMHQNVGWTSFDSIDVVPFQASTMKDLTLPIMILTQPNILTQNNQQSTPNEPSSNSAAYNNPAYESHDDRNASKTEETGCLLAFCDGSCHTCSLNVESLFEPFLMILSNCNKPAALYNVILPVINRWVLCCIALWADML